MSKIFKKIVISLGLTTIILVMFIYLLGLLIGNSNDDTFLIIVAASLHFTIIMCTLVILDENKKR